MHKALVQNWNEVVQDDEDLVYILGDLTMQRKATQELEELLASLRGRKRLILGNHDKIPVFDYLDIGFESVHTSYEMEYEGHKLFMCHDPAWGEAVSEDCLVLCGHVHTFFKIYRNRINVGVDVWNYHPISIDTILDKFANMHLEGCNNERGHFVDENDKSYLE